MGNGCEGPKLAFVALGCPKNLVDSERMLADLGQDGFVLTSDARQAEVIVVNTCGFLAAARQEALREIRRVARYKRSGRCRRLVVAGCLVQRDGRRLLEAVPEIDALVGVNNRDDIVRAARADGRRTYMGPYHAHVALDGSRLRLTPRHYAYLRISEGCSQTCTFCTIPAIRGPMRSKPPKVVLNEARELLDDGAVELVLIGQDTTSYGRDIDYRAGLGGLLRQLDRLAGLRWLRLMYAYPSGLDDRTIAAIADCRRVVKYVDVPIQHISDGILRAMGRRISRRQTERLLERLRRQIPGVVIRTTLMVGFPGESDQQFQELLDFVTDFRFDALGVFVFSAEPGTAAASMPGQVPRRVKRARADELMRTQQRIAFGLAASRIGQRLEVLVDSVGRNGRAVGRHAGQAPQVDSVTYLCGAGLRAGQFVSAICSGSKQYDLIARPRADRLWTE